MATLTAPTPAELAANQGPGIRAACLIIAVMATIAITLRLFARYIQKVGIGADDITIVMALVSFLNHYLISPLLISREAVWMGNVYQHFDRYATGAYQCLSQYR